MAKRKSNRAARHLLAQGKHAQIYRVSNRRQMNQIFDDQPGFAWRTKLSASQSRANKKRSMSFDDLCGVIYSECM